MAEIQGWEGDVQLKGSVDHRTRSMVLNSQYFAGGVHSPYSHSINVSIVDNFCAETSS